MATKKPGLGSVPSGLSGAGADASTLSLGVDTSGVEAAKPALDSFVASTDAAARAADRLSQSILQQQKAFDQNKGGIATVTKPIEAAYTKSLDDAGKATESLGFKTARSKTEILVLIHELSQERFKQFGGSLLVLAEQTGAATFLFQGLGLAAIAVVGAVGLFAAGVAKGALDSEHFNKSLLLTNNAAGQTKDTLQDLTTELTKSTGATSKTSRQVLEDLTATGLVGEQLIKPLADTILRVQKLSGQTLPEVEKEFLKLVEGPTKFALETDKAFNAINLKVFENIRALEEQGHKTEAARVAAQAFSDHFNNQTAPALGYVSKLLKFAADDFANLERRILSIGRDTTFNDKLDEIAGRIKKIRDASVSDSNPLGNPAKGSFSEGQLNLLERQRIDLLQGQASEKQAASYKAQSAAIQNAAKETSGFTHEIDLRIKGTDRLAIAVEKLRIADENELKARRDLGEVDPKIDPAVHAARLAQLQRDNIPQRVRGQVTDENELKNQVDAIAQRYKTLGEIYKDFASEQAIDIKAGIIDAQDAFRVKAQLIEEETYIQVRGLQERNAALQAYNDSHKGQLTDGKAVLDNEREILRNEEAIERARSKSASQIRELGVESQAYFRNLNAGYVTAVQNAEEYLRVVTLQHQREVENAGIGDKGRQFKNGADAIDERARALTQAAEDRKTAQETAGTFGKKEAADYDLSLSLAKAYQETSMREWQMYYKNLTAAENDWTNGASRALQNYVDQAGYTAKNTQEVFTKAFGSMEDALVSFVTTGKLDFKSLITSFITDLTRLAIQQQIMKPLLGFLGNFLGGGFGGADGAGGIGLQEGAYPFSITGAAAIGGSFGPGSRVLVNEKGPELLTVNDKTVLMLGNNSGKVTPAGGGGDSMTNVFNIASGVSRNELAALIPVISQHIETKITSRMRRPGFSGG